ncbi:MAG: bacteriohemerythrin [Spirochaetes bacterium]|nr:bacteriohemerythrin [Spirochaetota bacterium]
MSKKKVVVKWSPTFSCGIKIIDDQHKDLIKLINDMYNHSSGNPKEEREYFSKIIHRAVKYVKEHFQTEEKLMIITKFPGYHEHKKAHHDFTLTVIDAVKNFEEGKRFTLLDFTNFLKDWALSHIAFMDKDYANYFKEIATPKEDGSLSLERADLERL